MNLLKDIINEDLSKWFGKGGKGGWDRYGLKGQKLGKCGDGDDDEAYAACLSNEKAAKLGPKGRASFVRRKRAAQKDAGDAKKGGEQSKGQKPTLVKTKANEMKVNIEEKQLKGLEGIPSNVSLEKISKADKLRIVKESGNIINFFVPDWAKTRYKFWQVVSTGKIKKNTSGKFYLEGTGINKSSPAFVTMDELIDGIDWKAVEQTRRFNEGLTLTEKKYYITYNKGRGQGKDLEKEFDEKNFRTTDKPKVFSSYSDAKKYAEKMERMFRNSIGGSTAYYVSDEKMNRIDEQTMKLKLEVFKKMELFLEKNVPNDAEKWSYAKSQAKKKFDVYPSAYANGWASKKYKELGGTWKKEK